MPMFGCHQHQPRPARTSALIALMTTLLLTVAGCASAGSARAATVNVFPIPGAHVAAPQTQITFRGVAAAQIGAITVTGSKSGPHTGHIAADSDGNGGSFLPDTPFTPGENVTVATGLNIAGGSGGTYSFHVATPGGAIRAAAPNAAPRVRGDVDRFVSAPQLFPTAVTTTMLPHGSAPGDLFVAPQTGPVQYGPEILGPYGGLIWWKTVPRGQTATDFKVQTYRGQPVLTWWQGTVNGGVGTGQDEIYNSAYQPIATVRAGNGLRSDLHEFTLTGQNTALVTAYFPVYVNASAFKHGSKHQLVYDAVAQEIDIRTGLVLFQWDSLDHVPLSASYQPVPAVAGHPWDYFHINSIQQDSDGSIVISGRNTWAAYKVSHQSAADIWSLGGKSSTFTMGHDASFEFQHDVRLAANDSVVTIFDDGAGPPVVHKRSRGLVLKLDKTHMTATLALQDEHQPGLLANYEGSIEPLPNGDNFIGWGQQPFMTEFNSRGRPVFDARFVGANSTYRAFRFRWTGTPATRPSVAAHVTRGRTTVYASWNGASLLNQWRVLAGASPTALRPVTTTRKTAFETAIRLRSRERYVAVQALDRSGKTLSTSRTVPGT
jgi:Arylsulfotransferase (ASST)